MAQSGFTFQWKGFLPALAILATAILTVALSLITPFSSYANRVGKAPEDRREFLLSYSEPDPYVVRIAYTMDYVQKSSAENDIVFLGDSTCLHGISVASFEESTGLNAFNMASVDWIGWKGYILTLQQYLAHHPNPKMVVLCVAPYAFSGRGNRPFYEDRFIWSFGSGNEVERPKHRADFLFYRAEGIRVLSGNLNDEIYSTFNDNFKAHRVEMDPKKYKEFNSDKKGSIELKGVTNKQHYVWATTVSQESQTQMSRLCAICSSNNIKILIRIMPFKSARGADSSAVVQTYLNEIQSAWNNVFISEPRFLNYADECFYDNVHLNTAGAEQVSKHLAGEVRRILATAPK